MKKFLALLLAMVMTLVLAACGGGGDTPAPKEDDPPAPTTDVPPEEDPKDEEPEEPAEPEPPAADFQQVSVGETITLDFVELVIGEPSYGEQLKENTSVSKDSKENLFYFLPVTLVNLGGEAVRLTNSTMVKITFDDKYSYEGYALNFGSEVLPMADTETFFYAEVPPRVLENFEKVDIQFGFTNGFEDYDWEANDYEKTVERFDNRYQLISGGGAAPAAGGEAGSAGGEADGSAPAAEGIWAVKYYVDDFDQPTDQWYITTDDYFEGNFSNSATTKSELNVLMAVDNEEDKTRIAIFLYEYGRNLVKNSSTEYVDKYDVTMRTADGTDHSMTGTIYCGADRVFIDDEYVDEVLDAMKGEGTVSFHLVDSERTTSTYLFSIETSNFGSVYDSKAS